MNKFFSKLKNYKMLLLCIAACAAPFIVIALLSNQLSLSWLGLLLCVGSHLLMFKMMPNRSCHSPELKATKKQSESANHTLEV